MTIGGGELFKDAETEVKDMGCKRGDSSRGERGESKGDDVASSSSNCIMGGVAPESTNSIAMIGGGRGKTRNLTSLGKGRAKRAWEIDILRQNVTLRRSSSQNIKIGF